MDYQFSTIEKKWNDYWKKNQSFKTSNDYSKPKYYVLDMFPYPSGAGLHVGHPLGYIASDIVARYKMLQGYNVLHPMGFDSFGLPGEQYAINTGQHPAVSTAKNIATYKTQLESIGFCYDWDREVQTSDPKFYKWTQFIFLEIFNAWFNRNTHKAEKINSLVDIFETSGSDSVGWFLSPQEQFSAAQWQDKSEAQRQDVLMKYRLAFREDALVNWCEALGTVLANDEVVNGVSERGGHPVERKKMKQWFLRITEYADRLLDGLDSVDFSDSLKEMQKNWIGKSSGAEMTFQVQKDNHKAPDLEVYTTRPDTIFGVDFIVVAPEHPLLNQWVTTAQQSDINDYIHYVKSRSDVERMAETKKITGCFTGAYAINPFNQKRIPIWVAEYVLIGYGTGAVMAVPCGDDRDYAFAQHFNLPITNIWGNLYDGTKAYTEKFGQVQNSDFLSGVEAKEAMEEVITRLEKMGIGKRKINYKMRDAGFSRQRYWGEPFPIVYDAECIAHALPLNELPVHLPSMDNFKPLGKNGKGPLSNLKEWVHLPNGYDRETDTMPGYAGSSWYFLRYMDPHNEEAFCNRKASDYWHQVDLYVGGTEHAVGHLLYSRLWTKILFDLGYLSFDEPYKKLLNQGKITGSSRLVFRVRGENKFVSLSLKEKYTTDEIHVDVSLVDGVELDIAAFQKSHADYAHATFELEDGKYICGTAIEKMSKSKMNTVNPDELVSQYGADTFRLYEMFLGPIQQSKPWDTKGIEGTHRFIKKLWRLCYDDTTGKWLINENNPTNEELKILHKTIKKIQDDIDKFSFNTAVSTFMIAVNSLAELKCHKRSIIEPLLILLAPFTPFVCEELWQQLGHHTSIFKASFPAYNDNYVVETEKEYPVSVNGKVRTEMHFHLDATQDEIEKAVLNNDLIKKWTDGKPIKKIIYVKGRMINVVV